MAMPHIFINFAFGLNRQKFVYANYDVGWLDLILLGNFQGLFHSLFSR